MNRLLAAVLLMQTVLFVSDRYEWGLFSKGYTVLVTVVVTAFFLLVLGGCVLMSHVTQSRSQFSLATLLFLVPVAAIPCAWLAREIDIAQRQRSSVESLRSRQMESLYSGGLALDELRNSPVDAWLHSWLGREFFSDVTYVDMHDATDADIEELALFAELNLLVLDRGTVTDAGVIRLTEHKELRGLSLVDTQITDDGLAHLKKLSRLSCIFLAGTPVTDRGVKELRDALPECRVVRSRFWHRRW